jgi:hypothetical protein
MKVVAVESGRPPQAARPHSRSPVIPCRPISETSSLHSQLPHRVRHVLSAFCAYVLQAANALLASRARSSSGTPNTAAHNKALQEHASKQQAAMLQIFGGRT